MGLSTEVFLAAYFLSWVMTALLAFFPFRGPKEPVKAFVIVSSLPPLVFVGVMRESMMGGNSGGVLLLATVLNLSIVVGTGFDPLRAVVHWGEHEKEDEEVSDGGNQVEDVRPRKAWPVLLIFALSTIGIISLVPELFHRA